MNSYLSTPVAALVLILLSFALVTPAFTSAQQAQPLADPSSAETPPATTVAALPENARWTMKVFSAEIVPPPADAQLVEELGFTKTGATWRIQTRLGGKDVEFWRQGTLLFEPVDGVKLPLIMVASPSITSTQPFFAKGFYGVSWIKPDLYKQKADYKGASCFYYKGENEAWIDVKTLLPVAIHFRGALLEYRFDSPPSAPLTLPATHQEALGVYQDQLTRLKSLNMP